MVMLAVGPGKRRRLLDHVARSRGLEGAWIPTVLPVQLLQIGAFAIAAPPNEPTTTVARRDRGFRLSRLRRPTADRR